MSDKNKRLLFWGLVVLFLFIFLFLLIFRSFFGLLSISWWLLLLLVPLFVLFFWMLYQLLFKNIFSLQIVLLAFGGIIAFTLILGIPTKAIRFGSIGSNGKTVNGKTLYPCDSTTSTPVQKVAGYKTELFVSTLDAGRSYTSGVKLDKRTFSLTDYADENANPIKDYKNPVEKTTLKEDLFYRVTKIDESHMPGADAFIQLCNKDNMTLEKLWIPSKSYLTGENTIGLTMYLHGKSKLPDEGNYRVDAYFYIDGKWHLTDRMEIVLTK